MDNPDDYTKSVIVSQTFITTTYLVGPLIMMCTGRLAYVQIIACTVYHFVGQYISSPALGSAGILMKKVSLFSSERHTVLGTSSLPPRHIVHQLIFRSAMVSPFQVS